MAALTTSWTRDVRSLRPQATDDEVVATGAELLGRWAEPHRRYHTTRHLVEVLSALDDLAEAGELTGQEAVLARLAAWLHDAVYDPGAAAGASEAASAALAEDALGRLGLDPRHVASVAGLVRMTADHGVRHGSPAERAFHDADLWILSAPAERFDEYCAQVREEYAAVPDAVFRPARAAVLRGLLGDLGSLYLTSHGRRLWDGPARANVGRELVRLA